MSVHETFPYLEVTGTHRQLGEAVGEMFRGKIQEIIEDKRATTKNYDTLLTQITPYYDVTNSTFPKLIEELRGVSAASGVPFNDLFFHNMSPVTNEPDEPTRELSETGDHCTVAVSFNENGAVIGHNEDWAIESLDELYVLKATLDGITFLGLNYATFLPGVAASMNSHGLVQCINELPVLNTAGVPKNFIARAVLECKTLDEAENLIRTTVHESGYNHVLVQERDIRDIEVAGQNFDTQTVHDAPYAHTNHFLSAHMKQYEETLTLKQHANSVARLKRAMELIHPGMSFEEMKALLSDSANPTYPICRPNQTIGSVIIEPSKHTMHICYGLPTRNDFVLYSL